MAETQPPTPSGFAEIVSDDFPGLHAGRIERLSRRPLGATVKSRYYARSVTAKGPKFIRFFKPVLQILRQSGGSATTSEVIDRAIELLQIPESEQEVTIKNGQSRVRNQVQWSRLYLGRAGYLESSRRGVWSSA